LVVEDMLSEAYFIDETGKVKLQGKDFYVSKFKEGLINCKENGNWGFIDINNNFIIPPIYQYAREFSEGKSAVSPYKTLQGKPNKKTLFGFINHQNEMIIPPVFEGADIKFSEGLCAVWNNGYGYIDTKGELVIPYDLALGEHFSEELAVFQPKGKNKNYGFIDKTGKIVIEPIFTAADNFENGLASVIVGKEYENYRYGYIDKKGNYVWEPTR